MQKTQKRLKKGICSIKGFCLIALLGILCMFGCGKAESANEGQEIGENQNGGTIVLGTEPQNQADTEDKRREDAEKAAGDADQNAGLSSLSFALDKNQSIRNSNLTHFGYLTQAGDGRIYYVKYEEQAIYGANSDGSDPHPICNDTGMYLQEDNGYLYYKSDRGGIIRVKLDDLSMETVIEENTGEFLILNDLLYVNGPDGFAAYQPDGTGKQVLFEGYDPVILNVVGDEILFIRTDSEDISVYMQGGLFSYNTASGELCGIERNIWNPLAAGNTLSYIDGTAGTRMVYHTQTGEYTDLQMYAEPAVSDGTGMYCIKSSDDHSCRIIYWNETETEIFAEVTVDRVENEYLYLSDGYLYLLQQYVQDDVTYFAWSCYSLLTGERGTL